MVKGSNEHLDQIENRLATLEERTEGLDRELTRVMREQHARKQQPAVNTQAYEASVKDIAAPPAPEPAPVPQQPA